MFCKDPKQTGSEAVPRFTAENQTEMKIKTKQVIQSDRAPVQTLLDLTVS